MRGVLDDRGRLLVANVARNEQLVLIVDDAVSFRGTLGQILNVLGYRTIQAGSARQAVDQLRLTDRPPRLILMTSDMPASEEQEFLANLQTLPDMMRPTIIAISGRNPHYIPGAAAMLPKPVRISQLIGLLQRFMPLREQVERY
jgi:CheY-like chemotaxis protein